jgi:hypothetical protein
VTTPEPPFEWPYTPEEALRDHLARYIALAEIRCTHRHGGNCPRLYWTCRERGLPRLAALVQAFAGNVGWVLGQLPLGVMTGYAICPEPYWAPLAELVANAGDTFWIDDRLHYRFWVSHQQLCEGAKEDLERLTDELLVRYRGEEPS